MSALAALAASTPTRARQSWSPPPEMAPVVLTARANGHSWHAIAEALSADGITVTGSTVHAWVDRTQREQPD